MSKILILGARGMLGNSLADTFKNLSPVLWDMDELDITDRDEVISKIVGVAPEIIINAAAYTQVDEAEINFETAFAVNAMAVSHLCEAAELTGSTVVHYSTDYVFAGKKKHGYSEKCMSDGAVNTYGHSKLEGETYLQRSGCPFYLIRTAWLYGACGNSFVKTISELCCKRDEIQVVSDQFGSPTYTNDLARATKELFEKKFETGIYHLVNAGVASWYDLAQRISNRVRPTCSVQPISSDQYPTRAKRPSFSVLQNTRGPRLRRWETAIDCYLGGK